LASRGRELGHLPLSVEAIFVGYALSRLDSRFLRIFGFPTWQSAFKTCGESLGIKPSSLKNLRDEFDPLHTNARVGWWRRGLRDGRRRVHQEFALSSDEEVMHLASQFLGIDIPKFKVSKSVLSASNAAAERLRTGRRAEEFFLTNCKSIVDVSRDSVLDMRDALGGFDFRLKRQQSPRLIEIKGLRKNSGTLRFTDLEKRVAGHSKDQYALVVIHSLDQKPNWRMVQNPIDSMKFNQRVERIETVYWNTTFTTAG
jgi:Protein NO VEIN, C-terminal